MIPTIKIYLPELLPFIETLAHDYENGTLDSWEMMDVRVRMFFTEAMCGKFETVIPGWNRMASFQNGITQTHVMTVLLALFLLPDYQSATPDQQAILQWSALFH